jgi:hypothetical protein
MLGSVRNICTKVHSCDSSSSVSDGYTYSTQTPINLIHSGADGDTLIRCCSLLFPGSPYRVNPA